MSHTQENQTRGHVVIGCMIIQEILLFLASFCNSSSFKTPCIFSKCIHMYAFGEDAGGFEAHASTSYNRNQSLDNITTMKAARDILLSLSPNTFKISLSSCYNYTDNYRKGSRRYSYSMKAPAVIS